MRLAFAFVIVLLFAGPSHAITSRELWGYSSGHDFIDAPNNARSVTIYNDGGGFVEEFKNKVQWYASRDVPVRVVGSCRSACTLVLAYTNVCVYRQATFKFHMARGHYDGVPDQRTTNEMIHWMPWSLQKRLYQNIEMGYNDQTIISGKELIAMGAAREC